MRDKGRKGREEKSRSRKEVRSQCREGKERVGKKNELKQR